MGKDLSKSVKYIRITSKAYISNFILLGKDLSKSVKYIRITSKAYISNFILLIMNRYFPTELQTVTETLNCRLHLPQQQMPDQI